VTITGGVVAGTGLLLSSYATNVYYIAVTFGVITGTLSNIFLIIFRALLQHSSVEFAFGQL